MVPAQPWPGHQHSVPRLGVPMAHLIRSAQQPLWICAKIGRMKQHHTMTSSGIELLSPQGGKPVKMWKQGVPVEPAAKEQLEKLAQLPFVFHHVAVMPDVHVGKGSTIGSVIPTLGAVIPAAVGVDIGCGMMAAKTSLRAADLPDNLSGLRSAIEQAVPHGMSPKTRNHKGRDVGSWNTTPPPVDAGWARLKGEFDAICRKYPRLRGTNHHKHLGTLGSVSLNKRAKGQKLSTACNR